MPLVPAKCPNCGGVLDIDPSDAAICSHCGTPFISEKAINNYKITNIANYNTVNNITGGEIHIHTAESPEYLMAKVLDEVYTAFRNYRRDSVGWCHIENLITVTETAMELFEE